MTRGGLNSSINTNQCFDKAFVEPGESNKKIKVKGKGKKLVMIRKL